MARKGDRYWTEQDIQYLCDNYGKMPTPVIAKKFGVTEGAVRMAAKRAGIPHARKHWTSEQDGRLIDLMTTYSPKRVAGMLSRSLSGVYARMHRLRLTTKVRDDWYTVGDVCLILGVARKWVEHRIEAGIIPATEHYERTVDGRAKLHHIASKDLISFIRTYPFELQGLRPDMALLVDLLAGITPLQQRQKRQPRDLLRFEDYCQV